MLFLRTEPSGELTAATEGHVRTKRADGTKPEFLLILPLKLDLSFLVIIIEVNLSTRHLLSSSL
jgi:hypothetical protein